MTRDEETYFLRLMQVADKDTLLAHFTLSETAKDSDGNDTYHFDVTANHDSGYLNLKLDPDTRALRAAEMNVGFPTMIGLNRSPLELRILAEHIRDLLIN